MLTFLIPLLLGTILGFLIRGKPSDTFTITNGRRLTWAIGIDFFGLLLSLPLALAISSTTGPQIAGLIAAGLGFGVVQVLSLGNATYRKWVAQRAALWLAGMAVTLLTIAGSLPPLVSGIFPISDLTPNWLFAIVVIVFGFIVDRNITPSRGDTNVVNQKHSTAIASDNSNTSRITEQAYGDALREYDSPQRDTNLYARLLVEYDGDDAKVRARYIAERAEKTSDKSSGSSTSSFATPTPDSKDGNLQIDRSKIGASSIKKKRVTVLSVTVYRNIRVYRLENAEAASIIDGRLYVYESEPRLLDALLSRITFGTEMSTSGLRRILTKDAFDLYDTEENARNYIDF